jgi:hypothetical protein
LATATTTPTATPASPTATPGATGFTFNPVADAYVNEASPTTNYGSSASLRADASPDVRSYLRFSVQGLSFPATSATLRVYANSASSLGYDMRGVSDNSWSENINYNAARWQRDRPGCAWSGRWTSISIIPFVSAMAPTISSYDIWQTAIIASREPAPTPATRIETAPPTVARRH